LQKSRPTQNKRARERAKQEKQQQKAARRLESQQRKASQPARGANDEDPDVNAVVIEAKIENGELRAKCWRSLGYLS